MRYRRITPYLFIGPMIVGLLVFRLIPIAASLAASFTSWNVFSAPSWVGLANYRTMLGSAEFWQVLRNTGVFAAIYVPGTMVLGLALALLVNRNLKGATALRGVFFMPYITSVVAVAIVWRWIFATQYGVLNYALTHWFGVAQGPSWLGDGRYALLALAIVYVWQSSGFQMLLFLAGLQNLDASLEEAARCDGASRWQVFRHITLPLLSPMTFFILIVSLINSSKTFQVTYALTGGGPNHASTTLAYAIYQNAFVFFRMGYASALAYALMVFVGAVTVLNFNLRRRWVYHDEPRAS